jgi:hypothetical protein
MTQPDEVWMGWEESPAERETRERRETELRFRRQSEDAALRGAWLERLTGECEGEYEPYRGDCK